MLHRRPLVKSLLDSRPGHALVVTGLGSSTWDLAASGDHAGNFHFIGAMGQAGPFALGLAMAQPGKRVILFTGDGEMLMGLGVLATIANIAPLLGFLGTVVGMILSFEVIAEQGLNDPGAVAKGISVALLTTAYGLIVAFFTQPFYNYFTSKVGAYTREIETASNILFETLDEMDRMGASKA